MIFLSGAWTLPEAMPPAWLRALTYLSPMHYYIDAALACCSRARARWAVALAAWHDADRRDGVCLGGLRRVRMG